MCQLNPLVFIYVCAVVFFPSGCNTKGITLKYGDIFRELLELKKQIPGMKEELEKQRETAKRESAQIKGVMDELKLQREASKKESIKTHNEIRGMLEELRAQRTATSLESARTHAQIKGIMKELKQQAEVWKEESINTQYALKDMRRVMGTQLSDVNIHISQNEKGVKDIHHEMNTQLSAVNTHISQNEKDMKDLRETMKGQLSTAFRERMKIKDEIRGLEYGYWVYYPRGTKQHRAQPFYPEYGARFAGYGMPNEADKIEVIKNVTSVDECAIWCHKRRGKDVNFNSFVFRHDRSAGACYKNAANFVSQSSNLGLYYTFNT